MGQGYQNLALTEAPADQPVREFLNLQRASLSPAELEAFRQTPHPAYRDGEFVMYDRLATSRPLDLRLAAALWYVFGVSWRVWFAFYALVSTGSCLLVFLIARRLGGSFLPGFLAALVFCVSPLETFLGGWSVRDTSPLWFACAAFYVLICRVDRAHKFRWNALAAFALGACATIGIGWRWDVMLLAPFLGFALVVYLLCNRRPWRYVAVSLALFMAGNLSAYSAVVALKNGGVQRQSPTTGFHIAYYGDFNRCNLLGLENSFQVEWGDMQTFFEARRHAYARNPQAELPGFVTLAHAQACRGMYFQLLRYHAYRWIHGFPLVCLRALQGLPHQAGPLPGLDPQRSQVVAQARVPWLAPVHERLLDPLLRCSPVFFVVGAFASIVYLRERWLALALAGFALYFIAILFSVLPMQKNSAMLLLPVSVLSGVGLAVLLHLCWPPVWRRARQPGFWCATRWGLAGIVAMIGVWQVACWISKPLSVAARSTLIHRLDELCRDCGEPAPETVRGARVFSAAASGHSSHDLYGYCVTIQAGPNPGEIVCRHARLLQAHGIPVLNWTRHALTPNCEQRFFVSCFQGGRLGDPRPQTCVARITGDAKIVSSFRIDMSRWRGLPVSTVCTRDESSPGSPRIGPEAGRSGDCRVCAFADIANLPDPGWFFSNVRFARESESGRRSCPVTHVAVRDAKTGYWSLAMSDGRHFRVGDFGWWSPDLKWADCRVGDFDGDGFNDIIGRDRASGGWWLNATNGYAATNLPWSAWSPALDFKDPLVGDFNGDGLADLAGRAADGGQWWVTVSDGIAGKNQLWGAWPAGDWRAVQPGDFDGDGKTDIAGLNVATGQWTVALSRNGEFASQPWGTWEQAKPSSAVSVGDFDGDGRDDVAQLQPQHGVCRVGWSTGEAFHIVELALAVKKGDRGAVATGDFNGDGRVDVLMRDAKSGELRVVCFVNRRPTVLPYGRAPDGTKQMLVGDFTGDGRDDILSIDASGELLVGAATDGGFRFEDWGKAKLSAAPTTEPVLVRFWDTRSQRHLR